MSEISRRKLIVSGLAATAGVTGLGVAAHPTNPNTPNTPDHGGLYGPGETLTYAAQRLLTRHSLAREFSRSQISAKPFANELAPFSDEFKRFQADNFADWRLSIEGLVDRPGTFSVAQIKSCPVHNHITEIACEEGWSYIAEWIGAPLSRVLDLVGVQPQARYVVYFSMEKDWWDSLDMADALHPQTLLAYGMNGGDLPVGFGGPLRMRVPRQLGYKNVKFIHRLVVTDTLKPFGKGLGHTPPNTPNTWYAGI